jgi:predicted  nucleic acid-binding Zn-ribbon protein
MAKDASAAKGTVRKRQIELLRVLEELDMNMRDVENPNYQKLDFKLQTVDFLKSAEKKRKDLCKRIDAKLLGEYERIRKRYGGRVVVQVVNEFCGGCYSKLPSELATRGRTEVLNCPNCGRFLYIVQ